MTLADLGQAVFPAGFISAEKALNFVGLFVQRLVTVGAVGGAAILIHRGLDALGDRLHHPWARRVRLGVRIAAGACAAGLLGRVGRELGAAPLDWLVSPTHFVFAAALGVALRDLAGSIRAWLLALLSLMIVRHYAHTNALLPVAVGALVGFAVLAVRRSASARSMAIAQGAILLATWGYCWFFWRTDFPTALACHALFSWVLLRHVSFVVHHHGGERPQLGAYLFYLFFYPSCYGASEVYAEFAARNLTQATRYQPWEATRLLTVGVFYGGAFRLLPEAVDPVMSPLTGPVLWCVLLAHFVRSVCFLMSVWLSIAGVALLYGVTLRPNFRGLLTRTTPAAFWRAWRATMTNWLIRHVYIPLGGNRTHANRNIAVVFAASTLWHLADVPFRYGTLDPRLFVPVGLWGLSNALAIIAQRELRGTRVARLVARIPAPLRVPGAILGTMAFGTITTNLLGFGPATIGRFPGFLARVLSIAG
jgi:hypothetical protein